MGVGIAHFGAGQEFGVDAVHGRVPWGSAGKGARLPNPAAAGVAALPVKNAREFIAYARTRPGKLNYGTIGVGQIPYWAVKLFNRMAGIEAVEVVYKGTAEAMIDVAGGRLDYFFPPIPAAQTSRDKVRIVAVTSRNRSDAWPDVPSLHEDALPGYEMTAWRSFMGPADCRAPSSRRSTGPSGRSPRTSA